MEYVVIGIGLVTMLVIAPAAKSQAAFGLGVLVAVAGIGWLFNRNDAG